MTPRLSPEDVRRIADLAGVRTPDEDLEPLARALAFDSRWRDLLRRPHAPRGRRPPRRPLDLAVELATGWTEAYERVSREEREALAVEGRPGCPGLYGLGIPAFLWDYRIAADCAEDGVYEVLVTSAPLNVAGGAGSSPNALALK